jgi:hypothetical protein
VPFVVAIRVEAVSLVGENVTAPTRITARTADNGKYSRVTVVQGTISMNAD